MDKPFISCFATELKSFIQEKRNIGFQYRSEEFILHQFDSFCAEQEMTDSVITKELMASWLASFDTCCAVTKAGKASVIRQFSRFLLSNGKDAYIPEQVPQGKHRRIHVLNDEEIEALFREIDQYVPKNQIPSFHRLALEYRVLFRMLLCCGMRVSEARKLKKEDVDLQSGILIIKNAKGNRDRIVYISDDLKELCVWYSEYMKTTYDDRSEWFFPAREMDNLLSVGIIDRRFNMAWESTMFADHCPDKPTVHSLRHTFVVKRMNKWMKEGIPLRTMLPYLSKYLGHKSVEETYYYYHQVDTAFQIVKEKDLRSEIIIPEVP